VTPPLAQVGAIEVPRKEYLARLKAAVERDCVFPPG
jgi:Leu/Phe-tRNA-protein transferase